MLGHYMSDLANLSLEGNRIQTWRDLDYISGRKGKLNKLRELILIGNPIRELEYKNNRAESFRRYIYFFRFISRSRSKPIVIFAVKSLGGFQPSKCLTKSLLRG